MGGWWISVLRSDGVGIYGLFLLVLLHGHDVLKLG